MLSLCSSVVLMMALRGSGDSLSPLWFMIVAVVLDSGPAFSLGEVEITGLSRYPRPVVERLVEAFVNKVELWTQRIQQVISGEAMPSLIAAGQDTGGTKDAREPMPQRPYDGAHIFG